MIAGIYHRFQKFDWALFLCPVLLTCAGLAVIFASSFYRLDFSSFNKQIVFLLAGALLMLVLSQLDWRIFRDGPYLIVLAYSFCLLLLLGLVFWSPYTRGDRSWYKIGDFLFDPIDPAKIILIMVLAKYFSNRHAELYRIRHVLISGVYVALPTLLILLQPEFGSAILLLLVWFGVLIISGIKLRHFFALCLCGLAVLVLSWFFVLKDYHKARVISFIQPSFAPQGIGWNQAQAKIAIGAGGLFGQGIDNATQIRYGFLPASHTDFVFAGFAEEFGLAGIFFLLSLFLILLWRMIKISLEAESNFPRLFAGGMAILLASHVFINIGMNLGLLPIIGTALPFFSYGGSNLLVFFFGLGILQSMKIHP